MSLFKVFQKKSKKRIEKDQFSWISFGLDVILSSNAERGFDGLVCETSHSYLRFFGDLASCASLVAHVRNKRMLDDCTTCTTLDRSGWFAAETC